jgi:hypothetical protein
MSKRINIGISDEFHEWLVIQAKENGLALSAYATMLLNQARKNQENSQVIHEYMKQFASLPSEVLAAELAKLKDDDGEKICI